MNEIKLEVGKTYRNRKGEEVKITDCDGGYCLPYKGTNGEWYTEGGRQQSLSEENPKDLIEEVTRHTFAIPDGVKKVTVEQAGNRIIVDIVAEDKEPKPGDVLVNDYGSVYIFKEDIGKNAHRYYAWLGESGRFVIGGACYPGRPATPEEEKPLWDALKKAGKQWNPEAMRVEDVPEFDRIREWVWANLKSALYDKGNVAEAIEAYLKHKEGEK